MTRRLAAALLALAICLGLGSGSGLRAETTPGGESTAPGLDKYVSDYAAFSRPDVRVRIPASDPSVEIRNGRLETDFEGRTGVAVLSAAGGLDVTFDIPEQGLYAIRIDYHSRMGTGRNIPMDLAIDGQAPFEAARHLKLPKRWTNRTDPETGAFLTDRQGNELTPSQLESPGWQSLVLEDDEGYYLEPYGFFLQEGAHVLSLSFPDGDVAVEAVTIGNDPEPPSYADQLALWQAEGFREAGAGLRVLVEAERTLYHSDPVLHPVSDRSSAATSPSDAWRIVRNSFGGLSWQYKGQSAVWEIEAPEDGLYRLVFRSRQNYQRGVSTSRRILVDGAVPFREFGQVRFPFDNRWVVVSPEPLVALTKGRHEIRLEVVPSYPDTLRRLQNAIYELNRFYRQVIMITGVSSSGNALDEYRDYSLEREIPSYYERVRGMAEDLRTLRQSMETEGFRQGGEAGVIDLILRQLEDFDRDPASLPLRLKVFKDNISGAAAWILRLKEQPLELDTLGIAGPGAPLPNADAPFGQRVLYTVRSFLASFTRQYALLDNEFETGEALEVWVGLGRDQAQLIKRLVEDEFMPETGYKVNVNLVQQGLIPATLTGKGPDVALFVTPNEIVNLAARSALVPLSDFDGFEALRSRFQPQSVIPYTYLDKAYGVPVNESFPMLFYRKDVFGELALEVPRTWTEFYDLLLILQRNNLFAGIPQDETTFQTLLFQQGGSYYKDGWRTTGFDAPEALAAFRQWTEFFTKYTLPVQYDFYSRFRTGEMPLGIAPYVTYNVLVVAAPELRGLWGMAPVPGTVREDGTVDASVTGGGTGAALFRKVKNRDAGFAFLEWWTRAGVQSAFGKEIEILLGPAARYDTANIEAFRDLPWGPDEEARLLDQWSRLRMVPQTPVNYYISRNLANAFRRVVIQGDNHRETLNRYNREINKEILRKRQEFGLD